VLNLGGSILEVVDSCLYTFLFDTRRRRFRRVPRGSGIELLSLGGDWAPYERVTFDPEAGTFVVALNREGTRLLSAGWHDGNCPCQAQVAASEEPVAG
jgi:hypothetical protein